MSIDLDQLALEANERIAHFVNRSAGQHLRAMGINQTASRKTPKSPISKLTAGAHEGGNVWLAEDEPPDITPFGAIGFYAAIALSSAVSVAIIAGAAGWVYQTIFN